MNARHPSRLALAVFDCFVSDNEPLKGDLLEEFDTGRSHGWLWRQVIGAAVCQPGLRSLPRERTDMLVLGAAVLVLLSFEAVFITNVLYHLIFGPPLPDITGYAWLMQQGRFDASPNEVGVSAFASISAPLAAIAASAPIACLISRFHQRHYAIARAVFSFSVMVCTALSLALPFGIQFLTTLVFISGLLASGCVTAATHEQRATIA